MYLQDESSDDDGPGGASGNDGDGGLYLLADSERARGSGTVLAVHAGDIAVEEDQYVRGNPKPFQCWGYFHPKYKAAKIFENHLNPVMLVFIG